MFALLAGCSFETTIPGEGEVSAEHTTPVGRCKQAGLAVCVDFEDTPPLITDMVGATLTAQNVELMLRSQTESAGRFTPQSALRIANASRLDINPDITIEMWTNPLAVPSDEGDKQFGLFDTERQYAMNFEHSGGIECMIGSDHLDSRSSLSLGTWHHVACTFNGYEMRVYIDGKLDGCHLVTRLIPIDGTTGAAIGANLSSGQIKNSFIGELDNVHLYSRRLNADEICTAWGGGNCSNSCL